MVDDGLYVIWNVLVLCFVVSGLIISYRNLRRHLSDVWALIAHSVLLLWSLGHVLSLYLVFEVMKYVNLAFFITIFLGSAFRAMRRQSLSYVGMTVAGFGFLTAEYITILNSHLYWQWFGWLVQLGVLGFWTTFLLVPKIEGKFKKEEQKIHRQLAEKEIWCQQTQKELFEAKQHLLDLEGTFQRHVEQAQKLSIFFQISKAMGPQIERERILANIPEEIVKIWKVQQCGLYLWDEEIQALVLRYASGFEPNLLNRLHFKLGEGVAGWAALENTAVRLTTPEDDPRFKDKYSPLIKNRKMIFHSILSVPISIDGKNSGVVELINCQGSTSLATLLEKVHPLKDKSLRRQTDTAGGDHQTKEQSSLTGFTGEDEQLLLTLVNQIGLLLQNVTRYEENREAYLNVIRSLVNALEARDPYTRGHSEQTMKYAVAISHKMNLPEEMIEIIRNAASLHDIGKIGVKENILKKSRKLTADEYSHIKNHPFMGAQILKPVKSLQEIIPIVYHHHERFDGKGYLDGLQKDEIPLGARILTVADAYEAMTSDRPYHKGLQPHDAMEQLKRGSGTQFDPMVVEAFLETLAEEHTGSCQILRM